MDCLFQGNIYLNSRSYYDRYKQIGNYMVSGDKLSLATTIALEMMEEFISIMELAANQICKGCTLDEMQVEDYRLYLASHEYQKAIVCVWDADEYFLVLESAASKAGLCLDETVRLDVQLPEAEFGENLVSGGFQVWKGLSVDLRNDPLESLIEEIGLN
jgi:hypothetical protein